MLKSLFQDLKLEHFSMALPFRCFPSPILTLSLNISEAFTNEMCRLVFPRPGWRSASTVEQSQPEIWGKKWNVKLSHFLSSYDQSLLGDMFAGFSCLQLAPARIASDFPSRMLGPVWPAQWCGGGGRSAVALPKEEPVCCTWTKKGSVVNTWWNIYTHFYTLSTFDHVMTIFFSLFMWFVRNSCNTVAVECEL